MKKAEEKKTIIGFDKEGQEKHQDKLIKKFDMFNNLLEHITQFIEVEDVKEFEKDIVNNFKIKFLAKWRSSFPKMVSDEKLFELSDISLHKIESLAEAYYRIEVDGFNPIDGTAKEVDFNYYARNKEQEDEFKKLVFLESVMNENQFRMMQGSNGKMQLANFLNGHLRYNAFTNLFEVNLNYINSIQTIRK